MTVSGLFYQRAGLTLMQIKNLSKQLITLNCKGHAPVNLMPAAAAVEVSDELATSKYVSGLAGIGLVEVTGEPAIVAEPVVEGYDELDKLTLAELKEQAEMLGLENFSRLNKKELILAILSAE